MTISFSILLITVLVLISKGLALEQCDIGDCVHHRSCPAGEYKIRAVWRSQNWDSIKELSDFLITIQCNNTEPGYICCSKMSLLDTGSVSKNFSIENHPNIGLLPESCGEMQWSRILLPIEQNYPWLVLIAYNNSFHCAGTLINDRYVLTSAQCVKDKTIQGVRLGEDDVRRCRRRSQYFYDQQDTYCDNFERQDVPVESVIIHSAYKGRSRKNDIALLRLQNAADFSKPNIAPICLPKNLSLLQQNITEMIVQISDWKLDERGFERTGEVPIIYGCNVPRAGEIVCRKNSCEGDSGNPLMVGSHIGKLHAYVQYGVLHNSRFPCYEHMSMPRKYTDVTKYMEWILDSIRP